MNSIQAHSYLPDVFTLVYDTWGLRLVDLLLLPQFFLALTALFLLIAPLSAIHGPQRAVLHMRFTLCIAAVLLFAGFLLEGVATAQLLHVPLFVDLAFLLQLSGLIALGGSLLFTVHNVYVAAC